MLHRIIVPNAIPVFNSTIATDFVFLSFCYASPKILKDNAHHVPQVRWSLLMECVCVQIAHWQIMEHLAILIVETIHWGLFMTFF